MLMSLGYSANSDIFYCNINDTKQIATWLNLILQCYTIMYCVLLLLLLLFILISCTLIYTIFVNQVFIRKSINKCV